MADQGDGPFDVRVIECAVAGATAATPQRPTP